MYGILGHFRKPQISYTHKKKKKGFSRILGMFNGSTKRVLLKTFF